MRTIAARMGVPNNLSTVKADRNKHLVFEKPKLNRLHEDRRCQIVGLLSELGVSEEEYEANRAKSSSWNPSQEDAAESSPWTPSQEDAAESSSWTPSQEDAADDAAVEDSHFVQTGESDLDENFFTEERLANFSESENDELLTPPEPPSPRDWPKTPQQSEYPHLHRQMPCSLTAISHLQVQTRSAADRPRANGRFLQAPCCRLLRKRQRNRSEQDFSI